MAFAHPLSKIIAEGLNDPQGTDRAALGRA